MNRSSNGNDDKDNENGTGRTTKGLVVVITMRKRMSTATMAIQQDHVYRGQRENERTNPTTITTVHNNNDDYQHKRSMLFPLRIGRKTKDNRDGSNNRGTMRRITTRARKGR